jgi:hypothetical protein
VGPPGALTRRAAVNLDLYGGVEMSEPVFTPEQEARIHEIVKERLKRQMIFEAAKVVLDASTMGETAIERLDALAANLDVATVSPPKPL